MSDVATRYRTALTQHRSGDVAGAEQEYRSILADAPDYADVWHSLGVLLYQRHQLDAALHHIETALSFCRDKATYFNNYGVVLKDTGQLDKAITAFQRAVELDPSYTDPHANLAAAYLLQNDLTRAESELTIVLTRAPDHVAGRNILRDLRFRQGGRFAAHGNFSQAEHAYCEAASLPGGKELWRWQPLGFCPSVFPNEQSIDQYWTGLNQNLDRAIDASIPLDWRTLPEDGFTPSFNLPHLNRCCREVKEKFDKFFSRAFPFQRPTLKETQKNRKKIHVGFVVTAGHHRGFLRVHRHLLEHFDNNKFDVFVFCPEPILASCRQSVQCDEIHWIGLPPRFDLAVQTLFDMKCDILYHWKVGGGTLDYFLAMAGAAPIQCTSYGTHGTSGVRAVDYYISSSILEPPESASQYTERHILLDSYATSHQHDPPQKPATREELGLPPNGALYFCPHRLPKYQPSFDPYLRLILEKDTTGHVLLVTGKSKEQAAPLVSRLRQTLGNDLFRRVLLATTFPLDVYRKHLSVVSCVLDSPIYVGDLTTHDAFDQGVPVVTVPGELLVQRYTAGLYRLMGIESLTATDAEDYATIAVRLGTEPDYRRAMSEQIVQNSKLVFSPEDTLRDYERFFERIVASV
ncbi:MAG: tetratricopeptide repeat protein [Planctomycetaceae bacterium]|jgi:predicted O-linked N-acetylglucosamine transferase (SPINDLY family)|nr:tetratricopeptide repeat protein [Planctomycetaceae bacterium]